MSIQPGIPCVVVASGGTPVSESAYGIVLTPASNGMGIPVTIVAAGIYGGPPVIFVGEDGELWPGGIEPGAGSEAGSPMGLLLILTKAA